MKLPSLQYLSTAANRALYRFPCSLISSFVGVYAAITLIEGNDTIKNFFPWINLMLTGGLGIGLFFCVDVYSYNKGYPLSKRLLFDLGALMLLTIIYFTLPDQDSTQNTSVPYIRYTIYAITVHLVVAFIPFVGKGQINGFWNYNKLLFVRILTSLLYSGVLYGGLALALGSLDFLFDIDLHEELFGDMFVVIAGIFNTWFFLAGIPETFHDLEEVREYPKGIRIFSQYILLPLLILYMVILYVYGARIVITWSWPKGLVSYLISCVGVLGILTLLLLYPYRSESGHAWIRNFSRWYYAALLPLVGLLFYAIIVRVSDYGITINRYIILLLGVWLVVVAIYFMVGRTNIKFIPVSLSIIILLVSFGWWGMFSVSERSQVSRLKRILEESRILVDGKIKDEVMWRKDSIPSLIALTPEKPNDGVLNDSLHNEVYSILDYLDDHHGFSSIREWYTQDLDSIIQVSNATKERYSRLNEDNVYMRSMGLDHTRRYKSGYTGFSYWTENTDGYERLVSVSGYDYIVPRVYFSAEKERYDGNSSFMIDGVKFSARQDADITEPLILSSSRGDTVLFETNVFFSNLVKEHGRQGGEIKMHDVNGVTRRGSWEGKLSVSNAQLHSEGDTVVVENLTADILLRKVK